MAANHPKPHACNHGTSLPPRPRQPLYPFSHEACLTRLLHHFCIHVPKASCMQSWYLSPSNDNVNPIRHGHFGCHDNCEDTIDCIPGVRAIQPKDLMSRLQVTDTSTSMFRMIKKAFHEVKRADFILCNTVQKLEAETISALQDEQPTYAIGPVFPNESTKSVVATNLMSEFDCTQWLKTKPQGLVLYVSFGSYCQVTKNEYEEIAQGLLLSKVSFIWVLRPDTRSYEEEGYIAPFEDQISDRGFIVPWCSQIEVLSNPAIGGFLTHCGWNFILESMWFGVPMLCFAISTDQITNRKLVVDDWGIGLNLCDRKPITRLEVAEKINCLMSGKFGDGISQKEIKKARQTLEDVLAANGSSQQSLCKFIRLKGQNSNTNLAVDSEPLLSEIFM